VIESLGTLAFELVFELLLASALVWVVVGIITRFLGITDAAWRARFFLLPLLLPVFAVPLLHVLIRPLFLGMPSTPLENFLIFLAGFSPLTAWVSLGIVGFLLFSGAIHTLRPIVAASLLRLSWQRQCHRKSPVWLRCNSTLQSISVKMEISHARLVLTESNFCGSVTVGPLGSYVVISRALFSLLDDEELETLLAHELGHIRKKDTLLDVVVGVCQRLMAISPFAQSASRRFFQAREEAIDDLAIRASGHPLALASCLVKACRLSLGQLRYMPISGLLMSESAIDSRIRRLLEKTTNDAKPSRWYIGAFCGVIAVIATFLLFMV